MLRPCSTLAMCRAQRRYDFDGAGQGRRVFRCEIDLFDVGCDHQRSSNRKCWFKAVFRRAPHAAWSDVAPEIEV
jgi:hypothetical protein